MKIKILLSIPSLDDLGVQHDVRTLMQYWNKDKFDVNLLLHERVGNFASQFPAEWRSIHIDDYVSKIPKWRVISRVDGYRRVINDFKPDVVISFVPFCNYGCFWAKITGKHKFGLVVSEHAHVSAAMNDKENMNNLFMKFYRFTFRFVYNHKAVDYIKCIADESRQDLIKNHKINQEKVVLIYNPVPMDEIREISKEKVDHFWFDNKNLILINVGRLVYQKRQDILIKAFAKVKKEIDCKLVIIGSGSQEKLKKIAEQLKVEKDIYFAGFQKNPWKWMAKTNLFVLSSIWEGLPCVITEAITLGLPIVSTKCPSGPREMLLNGEAGYLCDVNNEDDLAEKIIYALNNKKETDNKVRIATNNLFRFKPELVVLKYEELVLKLIQQVY